MKKYYVLCPPRLKTGGTELLHQLVSEIKNDGRNCHIAYTKRVADPVNQRFSDYIGKSYVFVDDIPDVKESVVIYPETEFEQSLKFHHTYNIAWWLSVDNYLKFTSIVKAFKLMGLKGIKNYIEHAAWKMKSNNSNYIKDNFKKHYVQSQYAADYLKQNGINEIEYLSDYLNPKVISTTENDFINSSRENKVLYNPKKGLYITKEIKKSAPDIRFVPLENMTYEELVREMKTAKVYIDFGNHPGKDRMPREASINGCCIITGKRGSSSNNIDIPIPDEFKFTNPIKSASKIVKKIQDCFLNYNEEIKKFEYYQQCIREEPKKFKTDVINLLQKVEDSSK